MFFRLNVSKWLHVLSMYYYTLCNPIIVDLHTSCETGSYILQIFFSFNYFLYTSILHTFKEICATPPPKTTIESCCFVLWNPLTTRFQRYVSCIGRPDFLRHVTTFAPHRFIVHRCLGKYFSWMYVSKCVTTRTETVYVFYIENIFGKFTVMLNGWLVEFYGVSTHLAI